jgi:hypothetical protein
LNQPVDQSLASRVEPPVDRLVLQLRAYTRRFPKPSKQKSNAKWVSAGGLTAQPTRLPRPKPQPWVLVFDCETTTTPDQKLRFGAYQLRYRGLVWEEGLFYEPDACLPSEQDVLVEVCEQQRIASKGGRFFLRTRADFVDQIFYGSAYRIGAQIVGFNLPFDLSRLATGHTNALRGMKGGFSLELSPKYPNVAVRHLSAKSAFIQFVGTDGKSEDGDEIESEAAIDLRRNPDRGYFVDVKSFAATLTSQVHSLASLSKALGVETQKVTSEKHGEHLTPDYIRYCIGDVESTWQCFDELSNRLAALNLPGVGAYELFSEASLGKAYLRAMNVAPWRTVQPDFPPERIGQVLSGYFGGRAEVRIRRQSTEVLHCDFLSMYPTVCTLMRLWDFVRAGGVEFEDATSAVRDLLATFEPALFQTPERWPDLTVMVQVLPDRDLFPVRAVYRKGEAATIGLNYLTADEPMWFTLADVLAAKALTGKSPHVLSAIRYVPKAKQSNLRPVEIAGAVVDPAEQDFYRTLIDHRQQLKKKEKSAATPEAEAGFKRDQLAIKTLANATSYGIFVELNVEDYSDSCRMLGAGGRGGEFEFRGKKHEKPGQYFHPLLGALITGAARLMLALAERQVTEQGLDWAFCDTDSIAIANTAGLQSGAFRKRALKVNEWFQALSPYTEKFSILQVEDYNYLPGRPGDQKTDEPLYCFAVSAKRYALFNRVDGDIVIRKASGHGLGHLLAPVAEDSDVRSASIKRIGVPPWQEKLWREIVRAGDGDKPDVVNLKGTPGYDVPAASQYAATSPRLLAWFDTLNQGKPYADRVKPFNFMLSLQVKSEPNLAATDEGALEDRKGQRHVPRAAAPFMKLKEAADHAFDRKTGKPIARSLLKSHGRSLTLYHLHPEGKFHGGDYDELGILRRRHVHALAFQAIGKEADNIEAQEFVQDDEGPIEHPIEDGDQPRLLAFIENAKAEVGFSDSDLLARASASHHTLDKMRRCGRVRSAICLKLAQAAEELRQEFYLGRADDAAWINLAEALTAKLGNRSALARAMGKTRQWVSRVMVKDMPVTAEFRARIAQIEREISGT